MARKLIGTATKDGGEEHVTLNAEQLAFVNWKGPAVLHAPVGTGKTLALAERAAEAILAGVQPSRILCLTFTNRAAEEMQERILQRCGPEAREVVVRTFHGFGAWFLHVEGRRSGLPAEFLIFDDEDSIGLLSSLLREHGVASDSRRPNRQASDDGKNLYHWIQDAKIRTASKPVPSGGDPDEAWIEKMASMSAEGMNFRLRPFARKYHQALRNAHALDFADLILHTRWLLAADPKVRARWQDAFDLIQVDEMQDTHLAEYLIIQVLGERHGNVALAGDFDQTIYEWRGSRPEEVLARFQRDFPGARTFAFREDYRSTRRLLQLATAVASTYSKKPAPRPVAHAVEGEPAEIHLARDEITEANWIARQIQILVRQGAVPLQRIGVLTRTNGRATTLSGAFVKQGIPHITVETFEFFRRQEVKDALAYLRFLLNRYDESLGHLRPARLLRQVLDESGLRAYYERGDARSPQPRRLRNLEELLSVFDRKDRRELDPVTALERLLLFASLARNVDRLDPDDERVRVITVHQAKGLEFDAVFVAGLSEDEFPHYYAKKEGRSQEEVRLFYVAVTRARKRLFLSGHRQRKGNPYGPSPFLTLARKAESRWSAEL